MVGKSILKTRWRANLVSVATDTMWIKEKRQKENVKRVKHQANLASVVLDKALVCKCNS
jgi:hypothetical protein